MSIEEVTRKLGDGIGRLSMETADSELFAMKMEKYKVCCIDVFKFPSLITLALCQISEEKYLFTNVINIHYTHFMITFYN